MMRWRGREGGATAPSRPEKADILRCMLINGAGKQAGRAALLRKSAGADAA